LAAMVVVPASAADNRCESDGDRAPAGKLDSDLALRLAARRKPRPAVIEPLSRARYRVQFTASAELRDKLERLKALMAASVPNGDLAAIIDTAVTEKLERLEARRFGRTRGSTRQSRTRDLPSPPATPEPDSTKSAQTNQPRSARRVVPASSRYVPAEVRRTVYERDQRQCRYVDDRGRRCTARVDLAFHHEIPYAVGEKHSPTNLSLLCHLCRARHNSHYADGRIMPRGVVIPATRGYILLTESA
jgi:5-methylcytosine-specific restriction endonuclease McrA